MTDAATVDPTSTEVRSQGGSSFSQIPIDAHCFLYYLLERHPMLVCDCAAVLIFSRHVGDCTRRPAGNLYAHAAPLGFDVGEFSRHGNLIFRAPAQANGRGLAQ